MRFRGTFHVKGEASGPALVLPAPLSFWGGVDPETGAIIDKTQASHGALLAGKILVMPSGRGSSSASSVLAEVIRLGIGPVAIIMNRPDPIITAGAMVARALYGIVCPVLTCKDGEFEMGAHLGITVEPDGSAGVSVE